MTRRIHPLAEAVLKAAQETPARDRSDILSLWCDAGCPYYVQEAPPPEPDTIKVEIAIAVDPDGNWQAVGSSQYGWRTATRCAGDVPDKFYRITARVPIPQVQTIECSVEPTGGEE